MILYVIFMIIGVIVIAADGLTMYREYKKQNLLGVVFWGIVLIAIMIALT